MFRILGIVVSLLAALLCIAAVVSWVRSRHHADMLLVRTPAHHTAGAVAIRGGVLLANCDLPYEGYVNTDGSEQAVVFLPLSPAEFAPIQDVVIDQQKTVKFSFLGLETVKGETAMTTALTARFSGVIVPYWLILTIMVPIALRRIPATWVRRRRVRKGLCLGCGYDIRASTGRCPECGKEIPVPLAPTPAAT